MRWLAVAATVVTVLAPATPVAAEVRPVVVDGFGRAVDVGDVVGHGQDDGGPCRFTDSVGVRVLAAAQVDLAVADDCTVRVAAIDLSPNADLPPLGPVFPKMPLDSDPAGSSIGVGDEPASPGLNSMFVDALVRDHAGNTMFATSDRITFERTGDQLRNIAYYGGSCGHSANPHPSDLGMDPLALVARNEMVDCYVGWVRKSSAGLELESGAHFRRTALNEVIADVYLDNTIEAVPGSTATRWCGLNGRMPKGWVHRCEGRETPWSGPE